MDGSSTPRPERATPPASTPLSSNESTTDSLISAELVSWARVIRPDEVRHDGFVLASARMVSVLKPVIWCMIFTAAYVSALGLSTSASGLMREGLPYADIGGDPWVRTVVGSTLNGLVLVTAIVVITVAFVFMFVKKMSRAMQVFVVIAYMCFFAGLFGVLLHRVAQIWPLDWISFVFITVNLSVACSALVFGHADDLPHKVALVIHSVSITVPFSYCGEATVWATLILLIVWDLLAVLCKYGPLRMAMEVNHQRQLLGEEVQLPAGLVYEGYYYHIGTGDMVFFAVLAGRAWVLGFLPTALSWTGVLAGLGVTVLGTEITAFSTLPALPASLVFGILMMFVGRLWMPDFTQAFCPRDGSAFVWY